MKDLKIHPFLFNWRGQFERTCQTEAALAEVLGPVTVINSDDHHSRAGWIDLGDSAYFGDQFRKALELFEGDVLFHVQGDATYQNWGQLVSDARSCFERYRPGIYAPNINYTWWTSEHTDIRSLRLDEADIRVCACVDETAWFITKDVIQELRNRKVDLSQNRMGWGWDVVFCSLSFLTGRRVIRDYRHTINHPRGTGYDEATARAEWAQARQNLDADMLECISYIYDGREKIARYF